MDLMKDRLNTFFKYKDLLRELVVRDLKLKDCNDNRSFAYVPCRN